MSVWDDPELATGEFIKFENIGDKIVGVVTSVGTHRFDDGKVVPKLTVKTDDDEEKTLTAGQVRLKLALVEHRPEVGDRISIEHTNVEKRAGGKTLKHFEVKVARGTGKAATPPPAAEPASPEPPF